MSRSGVRRTLLRLASRSRCRIFRPPIHSQILSTNLWNPAVCVHGNLADSNRCQSDWHRSVLQSPFPNHNKACFQSYELLPPKRGLSRVTSLARASFPNLTLLILIIVVLQIIAHFKWGFAQENNVPNKKALKLQSTFTQYRVLSSSSSKLLWPRVVVCHCMFPGVESRLA